MTDAQAAQIIELLQGIKWGVDVLCALVGCIFGIQIARSGIRT